MSGMMSVSLFTLTEILKSENDQAHHENTTCMPYGCSAALCILIPHVNWALKYCRQYASGYFTVS